LQEIKHEIIESNYPKFKKKQSSTLLNIFQMQQSPDISIHTKHSPNFVAKRNNLHYLDGNSRNSNSYILNFKLRPAYKQKNTFLLRGK
jgi:hypothetical protein